MKRLEPGEDERLTPGSEGAGGGNAALLPGALARRIAHYKATGNRLSVTELCAEVAHLKHQAETAWLREIDSQSLQQALRDLDNAFGAFFARRAKFPRFRSKKRETPTFRIPQRVMLVGGRLSVPKVGLVKLVLHRPLEGVVKSATFKQDATGAWYVTLVVHFELSDRALPSPAPERARLIQLGRTPPFADGQIAAVAQTRQLVLVTFNSADYADFSGLTVEDWRA